MEGTEEATFGSAVTCVQYMERPWVGWFVLPTQVSKFQLTRGETGYAVRTAMVCKALGLTGPLHEVQLLEHVERLALNKGVPGV